MAKNDIEMVGNPLHGEVQPQSTNSSSLKKKFTLTGPDSISGDFSGGNKFNPPESRLKRWWNKLDRSMITVGTIVFVGDTSRGVLFPVLSTLNTQLRGSVVDLGYLVAMFSIGRLVVTAPLGYLSDKYRHKLPLLLANSLLILGAILWANAYTTNKLSVLYVAQFLLGVGSGSLGVTRSFVVEQCEPKKRTEVLALITALQYAGFTVSPIVGSWLVTLGSTSSPYWSFALPSYLIALLALWCLTALLCVFENIPAAPIEFTHSTEEIAESPESSPTQPDSFPHTESRLVEEGVVDPRKSAKIRSEKVREEKSEKLKKGMLYVILGMFLLNIATKGSIAVYETLGAQIGLVDYEMSSLALGGLISGSGAVGFVQLLLFTLIWTRYFSDLQLMLGGIGVMIIAQLIGLSYGHLPEFSRYVTSVVLMYAIGYPIGHTAVLGAFSKIQKSGPQAALMGWFATSGSFSRIILPIISGYLDKALDNSPFNIVLFMLSTSYLGIVLLKPQLKIYIEVEDNTKTSRAVRLEEEDAVPTSRFMGAINSVRKLWSSLSRSDKVQVVAMFFLMFFSIFDLVILSGGIKKPHDYTWHEDQGFDLD